MFASLRRTKGAPYVLIDYATLAGILHFSNSCRGILSLRTNLVHDYPYYATALTLHEVSESRAAQPTGPR